MRRAVFLAAASALGVALWPALAAGRLANRGRDRLEGAWTLTRMEGTTSAGAAVARPDMAGRLIYDGRGHMSAILLRNNRPPFASGDSNRPTPEEAVAAIQYSTAYFGTYTIDDAERTVTHHLEGSLFPNWVGSDQKRFFVLDRDTLTITSPPIVSAGSPTVFRLVWRRLSE